MGVKHKQAAATSNPAECGRIFIQCLFTRLQSAVKLQGFACCGVYIASLSDKAILWRRTETWGCWIFDITALSTNFGSSNGIGWMEQTGFPKNTRLFSSRWCLHCLVAVYEKYFYSQKGNESRAHFILFSYVVSCFLFLPSTTLS